LLFLLSIIHQQTFQKEPNKLTGNVVLFVNNILHLAYIRFTPAEWIPPTEWFNLILTKISFFITVQKRVWYIFFSEIYFFCTLHLNLTCKKYCFLTSARIKNRIKISCPKTSFALNFNLFWIDCQLFVKELIILTPRGVDFTTILSLKVVFHSHLIVFDNFMSQN